MGNGKTVTIALALLCGIVSFCPIVGQETHDEEYNDYYAGDYYNDLLDFGDASAGSITVFGTIEVTQQIVVITKETIEKSAARDLAALLEEEIGMSVIRYGGYGNQTGMNLRGFDTERIAILINGVPANSPRSGQFDINQIDLGSVERVEVIYGGSDTKYNTSGALGGVINIITIKKQKPGWNYGFAFSNTSYLPGEYNMRLSQSAIGKPEYIDLLDTQSLSLFIGHGAEQFSWRASVFGNSAGNHYLYEDDYGFARRKVSNEVLDGGGDLQLMFSLPKDAFLLSDTKLYYAHRNFPITMNSVGTALATDLMVTENVMFATPVIFRDDLATEASLSCQASLTNYGLNVSSRDHFVTAIDRWNWYPTDKLTVRSGLDWRFLYINTESPTESQSVKTGNQGGLYFIVEYKLRDKFLLIASLKGVTDTKQAVVVPKVGVSWQAHPLLTLKNNYFRSFKFPDFDDLYYRSLDSTFVGNPNLRPEDGWGTDLTAEFTPERYFSVVSTVFWQYTTDSIHWIKNQGGRWSPKNVGTACFAGWDFRPVFTVTLDKWNLNSLKIGLNYQFQFSWLLNGLSYADSFRIPYMPAHIVGGSVDIAWKTGSLLVSAHFESLRYADTVNEMPLDPYCIVNTTLNQNTGKHLAFFASLRNILDANYESFASYYMPGISLICGIRAKFDAGRN